MPDSTPNLETTEVISPSGDVGTVPSSSLSDALESGFRIPTADEHQQAVERETYGERPLTAAAIGATQSVLPFGLGAGALQAAGVPVEKIQQYNPGAAMAGEIGGLFVPSPIGIAKVAGKAGEAVSGIAGKVLAQPIAKVAGGAIEGALFGGSNVLNEGVIASDPNQVAEHALSEIGMSALLGGGISGALHFGEVAVPAAVSKAREALNSTADSLGLSSAAAKMGDLAKEGYASVASVVSGTPKEDILAAIANRGTEAVPLDAESITANLQKHVDALESAKKTALKDIRPEEVERLVQAVDPQAAMGQAGKAYASLDDAIKTMRTEPELYPGTYARQLELIRDSIPRSIPSESAPSDVFGALNGLKQQLDTRIPYERTPSAASQNAIGLIRDLRSGIKSQLEDTTVWGQAGARQAEFNDAMSDYLKSLNLQQQKGEFAKQFMYKGAGGQLKIDPTKVETFLKNTQSTKGIKSAAALSNYIDSSNTLLDQIEATYKSLPDKEFDKQSLKDFIDRNQAVIEQNQRQAQLNRLAQGASAEGSGAEPFVTGALAHMAGLPHAAVAGIAAAAEALRYPGQFINRLTKLEEAFHSAQQRVIRGAKALIAPSRRVAEATKGYVAGRLAVPNESQYEKVTGQIKELAGNPGALIDRLHENTEALQPHAPNTVSAMQQAGGRAITFLMSKIPQPQQGPLAPEPKPSMAQISQFSHYYKAVEDPISVLKDAAAGTLTHQGLEALSTVYPTLYQSMKGAVAQELSNKRDKTALPYNRRLMLSLFMGQDVDGSMAPLAVQSNQAMLTVSAMQKQQQDNAMMGPPSKARAKGLDNLSISNRALTAQQASSQRTA